MKRWLCVILQLGLAGLSLSAADKRLLLIAGRPSHPPGAHEFRAGCLLLQQGLAGVPGLTTLVYSNGWPQDPRAFDGADAVVIYADGGGGHPFIQRDRLKFIGDLLQKGVGFGAMHYACEVPSTNGGPQWLEWIGAYYEHLYSVNPMWTPEFTSFPDHPVTRGVRPFGVLDEWYFNLRWRADLKPVTPILVAKPSDKVRKGPYVWPAGPYPQIVEASGRDETMMWVMERSDGGRGFGFTGGHYHKNWGDANCRKVVLNAVLWIARLDVPAGGVESMLASGDLEKNLDPKKR